MFNLLQLHQQPTLGTIFREHSHVQAIERHPSSAICLTQRASRRKGLGAIEQTDVIQPKETTLEDIVTAGILAIHPPCEVEQELLEDTFEEGKVFSPVEFTFDLEDTESSPG